MRSTFLLAAIACLVAGCGSGNSIPPHSAEDQQTIDKIKAMTPEQQIERIQKGSMPQSAKDAQIKEIKDKNGLK